MIAIRAVAIKMDDQEEGLKIKSQEILQLNPVNKIKEVLRKDQQNMLLQKSRRHCIKCQNEVKKNEAQLIKK